MEKNCSNIKPILQEYLDRELETSIRKEVELHIVECESCRLELLEMEKLSRLFKENLPEENIPPALLVNTWQAVDKESKTSSPFDFLFTRKGFSWSLAMYTMGLFVMILGYFFSPLDRMAGYGEETRMKARVMDTVQDERVGNLEFKDF